MKTCENDREILVVDDDPVFRLLHQRILQNANPSAAISCCASGREALERVQAIALEGREVLVLLDLNMPGMNGWDFLDHCRTQQLQEKVPVVIFSSSTNREDKAKASEYEQVVTYCGKLFTRKKLSRLKEIEELEIFFNESSKQY